MIALCWGAFANPKLVPRGLQNLGEIGYMFVREQIGRPFLGKDTDRFMPLLVAIFFLVLVWNLMGVFPVIQFPVASHIAFPTVLAAGGLRAQDLPGHQAPGTDRLLQEHDVPAGRAQAGLHPAGPDRVPVEHRCIAPFTHALRLFANMFAGHMLLAFFSMVGFWFMFEKLTPLGVRVGVLGSLMTIAMTALEMFIQFLQAFLFAMLAAMYIGGSLHAEH